MRKWPRLKRVGEDGVLNANSLFETRFKPDQRSEVRLAREVCASAMHLRDRVSRYGAYDEEDLEQFWNLVSMAGYSLRASSAELGGRGGLTDHYFSSMARERRRPKLYNFLRALTAIVEIASERLSDVERTSASGNAARDDDGTERIQRNVSEIQALAASLAAMAHSEIATLDDERPNDPLVIAKNEKYRELLVIFADGFERIEEALRTVSSAPNDGDVVATATRVVGAVARRIEDWWTRNGDEAIGWGMRLSFFTAGVATLGWAGANMTVGTTAVAAIVGGEKVADVLRRRGRAK